MQPGLTLLLPASDTKAALKIKLCIMLFHPLLVPLAAWGTTLKRAYTDMAHGIGKSKISLSRAEHRGIRGGINPN
ncbi:MAG: hypothetical protein ACOY31_04875, partial [Bacillota bacterium]